MAPGYCPLNYLAREPEDQTTRRHAAVSRKGLSFSHIHTHTENVMGTKNIAISDEAYQRLRSLKKPGESFTELIERMTRQKGILDLAGVLTPREGRSMKEIIGRMREQSSDRILRVAKRIEGT